MQTKRTIELIEKIRVGKSMTKNHKGKLTAQLTVIRNDIEKQDRPKINEAIKLFSKGRITDEKKEIFIKKRKQLIDIVNKYGDKNEEQLDLKIADPEPVVKKIPKPVVEKVPKQVVEKVPKPVVEKVPKPVVEKVPKPDLKITDGKSFVEKLLKSGKNKNIYYYGDDEIRLIPDDDEIWFNALDIALVLQYLHTAQAISTNVAPQYKKKLADFGKNRPTYPNAQPHSIFINFQGLKQLISKSEKPDSIGLAKQMGIDIFQKITRIEIDIVHELDCFFKRSNITTKFQYTLGDDKKYRTDYYVPTYDLVIEIDENGHKDRDPIYEKNREAYLKKRLKCHIIRCNPDDPNFLMGTLYGEINNYMLNKILE
jgi:hypothetical protein